MMHSRNHGAAPVFQAINHSQIPQRPIAIHHLAENVTSQPLESLHRPAFQMYAMDVAINVESRIEFPSGIPGLERWKHHALPIARNQRQLRLNQRFQVVNRDWAVQKEYASDVQRHLLLLEIQEKSIQWS